MRNLLRRRTKPASTAACIVRVMNTVLLTGNDVATVQFPTTLSLFACGKKGIFLLLPKGRQYTENQPIASPLVKTPTLLRKKNIKVNQFLLMLWTTIKVHTPEQYLLLFIINHLKFYRTPGLRPMYCQTVAFPGP